MSGHSDQPTGQVPAPGQAARDAGMIETPVFLLDGNGTGGQLRIGDTGGSGACRRMSSTAPGSSRTSCHTVAVGDRAKATSEAALGHSQAKCVAASPKAFIFLASSQWSVPLVLSS